MDRTSLINEFTELEFDAKSHTYTVKGNRLKPVSNKVSEFVEEFDAKTISKRVARKTGQTQEEVLNSWRDTNQVSLKLGTKTHNFGEDYVISRYFEDTVPPIADSPWEFAIVKFWAELEEDYSPIATELRMYSIDYNMAGTLDFLLFNRKTKKFIICDYKTNKDLYKNYKGKTMLYPFHYMLDTPLNHYKLQLSYYQLLLEERGYEIEERWIIWLKKDSSYTTIRTEDFTNMLKTTM